MSENEKIPKVICARPNCTNLAVCDKVEKNGETKLVFTAPIILGRQIGPYCRKHWDMLSEGFNELLESVFDAYEDREEGPLEEPVEEAGVRALRRIAKALEATHKTRQEEFQKYDEMMNAVRMLLQNQSELVTKQEDDKDKENSTDEEPSSTN